MAIILPDGLSGKSLGAIKELYQFGCTRASGGWMFEDFASNRIRQNPGLFFKKKTQPGIFMDILNDWRLHNGNSKEIRARDDLK